MKILAALPLIFLIACNSPDNGKKSNSPVKDSLSKKLSKPEETKEKPQFKALENKKDILGVWTADDKELLNVSITNDSIYYTEHFESYKYDLKDDSIFIRYPDFVHSGKIGFLKDTLVFISEDGESKFFRQAF